MIYAQIILMMRGEMHVDDGAHGRDACDEGTGLSGPFAAGSTITMWSHGDDPIELTIAAAREPELFVDEARLGATVVRTIHRVEAGADDRRRVVYRMEIDGPDGEVIGPAISGDFPEVLAGLVARSEG
jgi:hypothetical protein